MRVRFRSQVQKLLRPVNPSHPNLSELLVKTAIIYARVSTKKQAEEELPIESQLDVCHRKAAELGADVVRVFTDEGISGRATEARQSFQEAIDYCGVYEVDYLITWNTARFARNHADAAWFKQILRKGGTNMVYVANNIDHTSDDAWLIEGFFEMMDEQYSRTVSKDTRRSMIKNARDGYFNGGNIPFGYSSLPEGKRRRLVINEGEAAIVRQAFAEYLTGTGGLNIALALNRRGLYRRGGKHWDKKTVLYLLKNWVYAGYVTYNRHDVGRRRMRSSEEWIRVKGHQEIISPEEFAAVQQRLLEHAPAAAAGSPKSSFLFTGLLACGECDATLQIENATGRGKVYRYYNCRTALAGAGCKHRRIAARPLDDWLLQCVLDRVLTPKSIGEIIAQMHEVRGAWTKERALRRAALVAEMRNVETRRRKLLDVLELLGKDAPNLSDIGSRLAELNQAVRRLTGELEDLEHTEPPAIDVGAGDIEELTTYFRQMVEECEDPKRVRAFLSSFIERVVLHQDHAMLHIRPDRLIDSGGAAEDGGGPGGLHSGGHLGPHSPVHSVRERGVFYYEQRETQVSFRNLPTFGSPRSLRRLSLVAAMAKSYRSARADVIANAFGVKLCELNSTDLRLRLQCRRRAASKDQGIAEARGGGAPVRSFGGGVA
jgi:site-specific DNA recombinase